MTTSQTPLVLGTDFITVGTTDFDAARECYGSVLGLRESKRWGKMPAAEFETGNLTIAVMQSDAFGIEFRPNTLPIELRVEDVEAARATLTERGVTFKGDTLDSGVCHQAFFTDPDGNALAIHHRYAPGRRGAGRVIERDRRPAGRHGDRWSISPDRIPPVQSRR